MQNRFKDLATWYLDLEEVKAKNSYRRDKLSVKSLLIFFGDLLLKEISPAMIEEYKPKRLAETTRQKKAPKPATINRELACLKTIFNKAIKNGRPERNPDYPLVFWHTYKNGNKQVGPFKDRREMIKSLCDKAGVGISGFMP